MEDDRTPQNPEETDEIGRARDEDVEATSDADEFEDADDADEEDEDVEEGK